MRMKLSSEKQYLVLDNQRLVYYIVNKLGVTKNSLEYEDLVSIGKIGLVKAAITFDTSKGNKFATYAIRCIENEIFMYYRKAKKYANDISIDETIGNDGKGNEITLGETIGDPRSNFVEKIENKEEYISLLSIVLNCLKGKHRIVLLYRIGNILQMEIANKLNISRSYASRIEAKAILEVKKIASQQVHYKEVFSMEIVEDKYRISFSSKDVSNFNKIFATLLQNLTSVEKLPDFKVDCNKERILIQIPAHPESFSFIAEIIQEIDNYSISFIANKTIVSEDDTSIKKFKTDTECIPQKVLEADTTVESKEKAVEVRNSEQFVPTMIGVDKVDETNSDSTVQRGIQIKQVRKYMLSMDYFTVKALKFHFPNFNASVINNAIYLAKSKGLITAMGKGEYVVNKT